MRLFSGFGLVSVIVTVLIGVWFLLQAPAATTSSVTMNPAASSSVSTYGEAINAAEEAAKSLER